MLYIFQQVGSGGARPCEAQREKTRDAHLGGAAAARRGRGGRPEPPAENPPPAADFPPPEKVCRIRQIFPVRGRSFPALTPPLLRDEKNLPGLDPRL